MNLSDRELASVFWLILLLATSLFNGDVRRSIGMVVESLSKWRIWSVILLYALVLMVSARVLLKIGLWSVDDASTLVLWAVTSGLPIVFSVTEIGKQEGVFKKTLMRTVELSAFIAFFLEMYSFPLWLEILLQPALLVFWTIGYTELVHESDPRVRKFARRTFWLLVVAMALQSARGSVWSTDQVSWTEVLTGLVLPMFWTVVSLGFLWGLALAVLYEQVAVSFRIGTSPDGLPRCKTRLAVFSVLWTDLEDIAGFNVSWANRVKSQRTLDGARSVVQEYKDERAERRSKELAAQQRLVDMAGVRSIDENGRQLDQRGFMDWAVLCSTVRRDKR